MLIATAPTTQSCCFGALGGGHQCIVSIRSHSASRSSDTSHVSFLISQSTWNLCCCGSEKYQFSRLISIARGPGSNIHASGSLSQSLACDNIHFAGDPHGVPNKNPRHHAGFRCKLPWPMGTLRLSSSAVRISRMEQSSVVVVQGCCFSSGAHWMCRSICQATSFLKSRPTSIPDFFTPWMVSRSSFSR